MVQQVITFLYLVCEELTASKENIRQTPHFTDVAKSLLCLFWFLATLDVLKLSVIMDIA